MPKAIKDVKKMSEDELVELGIRALSALCAAISLASTNETNARNVEARCIKFENYIKGDLV